MSFSLFDLWFYLPSFAQPLALVICLISAYLISRHALSKPNWGWANDYGAKYLVIVLLTVGVAFAQEQTGTRLIEALKIRIYQPVSDAKISSWLAPPDYTGESHKRLAKEMSFNDLQAQNNQITILEGSVVKFIVEGDVRPIRVYYDDREISFNSSFNNKMQQTIELNQSGLLELNFGGGLLLNWDINILRDRQPNIAFAAVPKTVSTDKLEVSYNADDDYNLNKVSFHFRKAGEEKDKVFTSSLPVPNSSKNINATQQLDFTTNKWAGTIVMGWLSVEDGRGQTNTSEVFQFILPQLYFSNPVAQNIINIRKSLLLEPTPKEVLGQRLKLISDDKNQINNDYVVYMALRTAYWRLSLSPSADISLIASLLWNAALRLEESTSDHFAQN